MLSIKCPTPIPFCILRSFPTCQVSVKQTTEDISNLSEIVKDTNIFIVSDEAYEHIIFDGRQHESMTRHPQLARRSFVICSFGKTYHTTGWKIGYCLAPEPLSVELQKIHQYLTFASNTPIQMAYAEFMQNKDLYLDLGTRFVRTLYRTLSMVKFPGISSNLSGKRYGKNLN